MNLSSQDHQNEWSILLIFVSLHKRDLEKLYLFFSQLLLVPRRGGSPDIPPFGYAVVHFESLFSKIMAHVIEILMDIFHNLFGQSAVVNGDCLFARLFSGRNPGGYWGDDPFDFRVAAKGATHQFLAVLFLKRMVVLKPSFKDVPSRTFQVKGDHILLSL